jgi:hypothetical protein
MLGLSLQNQTGGTKLVGVLIRVDAHPAKQTAVATKPALLAKWVILDRRSRNWDCRGGHRRIVGARRVEALQTKATRGHVDAQRSASLAQSK